MICTCTRPWSSSVTSRRMPRSAMVTTGSSGSGTSAAIFQAARASVSVTTSPPGASGAGAASRRAGSPSCSVCRPCRPPPTAGATCGTRQRRLGERPPRSRSSTAARSAAGRRRPGATSAVDRARTARRRSGHTASSAACIRRCDSVGAVAEPQRPVPGVVEVVGDLLDRLAGDARPASASVDDASAAYSSHC